MIYLKRPGIANLLIQIIQRRQGKYLVCLWVTYVKPFVSYSSYNPDIVLPKIAQVATMNYLLWFCAFCLPIKKRLF